MYFMKVCPLTLYINITSMQRIITEAKAKSERTKQITKKAKEKQKRKLGKAHRQKQERQEGADLVRKNGGYMPERNNRACYSSRYLRKFTHHLLLLSDGLYRYLEGDRYGRR